MIKTAVMPEGVHTHTHTHSILNNQKMGVAFYSNPINVIYVMYKIETDQLRI